ncbi:MAG: hypothetical protein P8010_17215 [Desulfosarcinaceae bacterium]|jgi:hypothetical protein
MPVGNMQIQLIIAHKLPGRLRLRLSHPPNNTTATVGTVLGHPAVRSAVYTEPTSNLLILFDAENVSMEEIILRTALCLSVDHHFTPVTIETSGGGTPLSPLSILAGLSILASHMLNFFSGRAKSRSALEIVCGLSATAAVSEHIYLDMTGKAGFHPEVLSIGYLISSLLRGNVIRGATTAWIMTFARHLLEPPSKVLRIEASAVDPSCDADECAYEASISREVTIGNGAMGVLSHLPNLLLGMYTDTQLTAEDRLFKEIQKLSRDNDDILAGLEQLHGGIRLQVRS